MDPLITTAARALAAGDPLGALKRVALRDDAPGSRFEALLYSRSCPGSDHAKLPQLRQFSSWKCVFWS